MKLLPPDMVEAISAIDEQGAKLIGEAPLSAIAIYLRGLFLLGVAQPGSIDCNCNVCVHIKRHAESLRKAP